MSERKEHDRRRAVARYLEGERPSAICASLGYSRWWFYKWWRRFMLEGPDWFHERSRRPQTSPTRVGAGLEQLVTALRARLEREGLFSGAQAIHWELTDLRVEPIPSVRTIGRMLARHELTRRRQGPYVSKGRRYPTVAAARPGVVHQSDFVGPCYLRGPVRFYSLHSVDVATNRCAVEPMLTRRGQRTIDAFWASWCRLGLPQHPQVDNASVFYGSPTHPRGMGSLIRLCLPVGVELIFPQKSGHRVKPKTHCFRRGGVQHGTEEATTIQPSV